jgi:hypothetical protein
VEILNLILNKILLCYRIKEDEKCGACSRYGRDNKHMKNVALEREGKRPLDKTWRKRKIILRWDLHK